MQSTSDRFADETEDRTARTYKNSILISYDCKRKTFSYPPGRGQNSLPGETRPLWQILTENGMMSVENAASIRDKIEEISDAELPQVYFSEYPVLRAGRDRSWYRIGFVCAVPGESIQIIFTNIDSEVAAERSLVKQAEYDELTGLYHGNAFSREVDRMLRNRGEEVLSGEYAIVYFDVLRFKAINDIFGMAEGDRLLVFIADTIRQNLKKGDLAARIGSDRFVMCVHMSGSALEELLDRIFAVIAAYALPFQIMCNAGIYVIDKKEIVVDAMIDRAILAQASIKGSYAVTFNYYTEALRNEMLSEQEIVGGMTSALEEKQFVVYYQPQYNHSTGMLVGAEALVRWNHPERGLISPGAFIPLFEKNGFITKLDFYVFERTCSFLRGCMEKKLPLIPISTNFSRHDIFREDFAGRLEEIRTQYDIPVKYLRLEITESAMMGDSHRANEVIRKLHQFGYRVEMDDFGSGYSSLNVLKDIELDLLKLDMLFLSDQSDMNRGGTILSSVVRMAKWLGLPVIAEGVETVNQADFLRSIGCDFVQGYLYSRPLPEEEYAKKLSGGAVGEKIPQMDLIETMNTGNFWNPESLETLIFSNYVGGAAILDYSEGKLELLRVNKKYLQELGMNLSEKELIQSEPLSFFDELNRKVYLDMLKRAVETGEEQECETWRNLSSSCCGKERICIRSNVRMIGKSGENYLFYAMIRNVTAEKNRYTAILDNEKRFKMASEQVNIYYWEYTVATHEMRPCFRCMRDLGLPALLTNYPDSAIEMGIFPPEVADMYRDWHRQIAEGVPELEAVIPLTVGRIPFRVRYTTEFDENGRPVKAYGSAALVV